jgi:isoleucyl-tRNA synthetase
MNDAYEKYDFATTVRTINSHVIELSSWYFDLIKDTLYCELPNNKTRRTIQTVLYTILRTYLIYLAPIMPHTCEEVYTHFNIKNKQTSIALESWFYDDQFIKAGNLDKWAHFYNIKNSVYAELEKIRINKIINKNNQALVEIKFKNQFNFSEQELAKYLNVAKVKITKSDDELIVVKVSNANLIKCERCWNYYEKDQMHDDQVCTRCHEVLKAQ